MKMNDSVFIINKLNLMPCEVNQQAFTMKWYMMFHGNY